MSYSRNIIRTIGKKDFDPLGSFGQRCAVLYFYEDPWFQFQKIIRTVPVLGPHINGTEIQFLVQFFKK
jgi:hypothetical protein